MALSASFTFTEELSLGALQVRVGNFQQHGCDHILVWRVARRLRKRVVADAPVLPGGAPRGGIHPQAFTRGEAKV
eukprot:CAMPEP_0113279996 /NCGR_PEP_ID=MMETSP0008_2-20120614/27495_1 /TAXON_ID=97485 /ORGANISM="Prymnesium parvum" /LENGTH=74 /DNA_ID=CAMNT_0000130243 /DNA_START=116 /DNA_END=340 /DNA_ORIENTATION=+ /assembly_acc=CAM_ASM_000153